MLIINIRAESTIHIEKFFTICHCQVDKLDRSDIGNINHVSEDVISSWQKIIYHGNQLKKVDPDINMDYNYNKSNSSSYSNSLTEILELIIGKIEMSKKLFTKIKSSHFDNNLQAILLCDIFQDRLFFNELQRIIIEKVLNSAIFNERN